MKYTVNEPLCYAENPNECFSEQALFVDVLAMLVKN